MIYRIDVATLYPARNGQSAADPLGTALEHQIAEFGATVGPITTRRIFLIDTDADQQQVQRVARELLADPIIEEAQLINETPSDDGFSRIEIHLKPGVMDPVAASTEAAIRDMGLPVRQVRTGRAYLIHQRVPREQLQHIAQRVLANDVIESVHFEPWIPREFHALREQPFQIRHVPLRELSDEQLTRLSRDAHLFLSLAEMQAIQSYYRDHNREPTDIELETIAQTWSEHCVHKTLKSAVEVRDQQGNVLRRYKNLIKETIFNSTQELIDRRNDGFCLSVFKDNAGVIAFDDTHAVCFKVETHNHPSAIEPYGGAATGVGGVIRDVLGTGLGAKPIANTDVFCVADVFNTSHESLPKGIIHPRRILQQVVAGVRDYGNRMGIPTVNGAVYFDNRYLGNPLVFCGCAGLIPRDKIDKAARPGDAIVVMGGRTGRDGIHGATFSSAELTDTHADEFSHAVQIGNAITQKKMGDVILQAREQNLFTAITDCGAGGLSSAVGEMGADVGADVELSRVPLKYTGLRYDEIWISEAQERMVLSVPAEKVEPLMKLAASEDVEATVIGTFGTESRELILRYRDNIVGTLSMEFLHEGLPMPTRRAIVGTTDEHRSTQKEKADPRSSVFIRGFKERLLSLLAHPNIASKHWIIRQYDHEVQGTSVIKPLTGPLQIGPSDAAVIRPKLNSFRGVGLGCGLVPHIDDPYRMAIASIDEAVRNVVAIGADPNRTAILDNFCWPGCDDEKTMGDLVLACEACRDAAIAYGIPFISGKDSLNNQFTVRETGQVIRIPNTLLISAIAVIDDVRRCVTIDLKNPGARIALVSTREPANLEQLASTHRAIAKLIADGKVSACHDISDGGVAVALAEMCIASGLGATVNQELPFDEQPGQYLLELRDDADLSSFPHAEVIGAVQQEPVLTVGRDQIPVEQLTRAWRRTLDW